MQLRDNILKIESDPTNMTITVGDVVFDKPYLFRRYVELPSKLKLDGSKIEGKLIVHPKAHKQIGNKEYNQSLAEILGMPPTLWMRVFNREMGKLWIDPVNQFDYLFRGMKGRINTKKLKQVYENKELLLQAKADGQDNIIPLINTFGLPPKEIKKKLGKGLWKQLCANSRTRNQYIVKEVAYYIDHADIKSHITSLNKLPSTVLQQGLGALVINSTDSVVWAVANKKTPLKNKRDTRNLMMIYRDTRRMANDLGEPFNEAWSLNRMEEQHTLYTKLMNKRKYGTEPFGYKPVTETIGDFTGTLLMNPSEVVDEGMDMHHCVSAYARQCYKDYAVFSITRNGEKYSTLGIRLEDAVKIRGYVGGTDVCTASERERVWSINQHYKAFNKSVDHEDALDLARELVHTMNTMNRERKEE